MDMTTAPALDGADFETHRQFLFGVAYRMLGSASGAEDVVQDAYLRARATDARQVRSMRAFLVTIVTRLCLDELKTARSRRETYVGPWLPEPVPTGRGELISPEATLLERETISLAFLVLLERLSPVERAVFLLREVFEYDYAAIAEVVGRSEAACRQAFRRARLRVADGRRLDRATSEEQQRMTVGFLKAAGEGDLASLVALLADDVVAWMDGGGRRPGIATQPILGSDRVARFIAGIVAASASLPGVGRIEIAEVNGESGVVWRDGAGAPATVVVLEAAGGRVAAIRAVWNPDKLVLFARPPTQ
jgi:RNA polymerase sigma-70 factor (ECF subfamily)